MLQYAPWTLPPGCNIEKGRGGRNVKIIDTENLLVEPNGSFSESVSTTFVHDCSYGPNLRVIKQSPFELALFKECASSEKSYSRNICFANKLSTWRYTITLVSRTMAVHVGNNSWYISLPLSAKVVQTYKSNAVSVGKTAIKPYRSICLVCIVWFARYCGKMYNRHLFSYGGLFLPILLRKQIHTLRHAWERALNNKINKW